jgi:putative toxin-antitoxin system antitoxin component (TIGR02293 family)
MTTVLSAVLGSEKQLGVKIKKAKEVDSLIRKGIPFKVVEDIKEKLKLADEEIAGILGMSVRTLSRRRHIKDKEEARLNAVESDRLFRLVKIFALAQDVFEDKEQAIKWLHSRQFGLGKRIPLEVIQTEVGAREAEDLLMRIEHGVYS